MLFIFDMDNVLYDYHWRDRMASLTEVTGMDFHELRRRWWHDEGEWQAEAGNPDTGDEYIARVNEAFGSSITRQEWVEMRKQAMVFRPEVAEAAAFAKKHGDLTLLTNNGML
ncbi:MAG: hydrolase, partial [Microbacteriaceae bacterium]|nr:hydrolase [Microbacteriaceae bacterium]